MAETGGITIAYALTRGELWRMYRWYWLHGLWKFHLATLVAVFIADLAINDFTFEVEGVFRSMVLASGVIVGFVAWPQIRFKPEGRVLTIDIIGIETTRGNISANVPWDDVKEIVETDGYFYILRNNRNAFIIPFRAFRDGNEREDFKKLANAGREAAVARNLAEEFLSQSSRFD